MGSASTGDCSVGVHKKVITLYPTPYKVYGVIDGGNRITDRTDEGANQELDIVRTIPPTLALSHPNLPSIAITTRTP